MIHDSEDSLQALETNWDPVHVQTNWKLKPCYKPLSACENPIPPPTLSPTTNAGLNVLPSESSDASLVDLVSVQSDGELTTRPVIGASDNSDLNDTDTFLVQQ